MSTFQLQVVAPDKPAIAEEATLVVLPGELGEFGVMAQHMAFLSTLKPGTVRIVKGASREHYFVAGAQKAKAQAQEQLLEKKVGVDLEAAKRSLARAEARLKTAEEAKTLKK